MDRDTGCVVVCNSVFCFGSLSICNDFVTGIQKYCQLSTMKEPCVVVELYHDDLHFPSREQIWKKGQPKTQHSLLKKGDMHHYMNLLVQQELTLEFLEIKNISRERFKSLVYGGVYRFCRTWSLFFSNVRL